MKTELSMYLTDYTDSVAFELLHFLNDKMESPEEERNSYAVLNYPNRTNIYSFWDDSQSICINGVWGHSEIIWLDNDQLLIVIASLPIWDDDNRYFDFKLLPNAENIILKKKKKKQGKDDVELCIGKETLFTFESVSERDVAKLQNNMKITSLLTPTSFEQILEKGYTGPMSKRTCK